jgi:T5orf172 domain
METRQECEQRHGGWIYAAREGKTPLVKIGVTACVEARMKTLRSQFGCPFTLLGAVQVTYRYPWTVEFKVHRLLRAGQGHMRSCGSRWGAPLSATARPGANLWGAVSTQAWLLPEDVQCMERGHIDEVHRDTLKRLAKALGVSADWLLGLKDEMESMRAPAA